MSVKFTPRLLASVLLVLAVLPACRDGSGAPEREVAAGQPLGLFAVQEGDLRLEKQPSIIVGLDASLPLHRVAGAIFFGDGIVIANGAFGEIVLVDSSGVLVKRQGTRGSGPGEYISLDGVVSREDGLLAWDAYHSRVSLLDSALEHVRDVQIPARAGNAVVGAPGKVS